MAVTNFSTFRTGRLPHDPARVAAVTPHVMALEKTPTSVPHANIIWTPTLARNDVLPTCSVAGLMNSARMWALANGYDLVNTEAALLSFYAALAGCAETEAAMAATDGLVLLDALEKARDAGFTCGEQTPIVPLFSSIPLSGAALKDAIWSYGSAYVGVMLYEADVESGAKWVGGVAKAGAKVGGHCVAPWNFTPDSYGIATWGGTTEADPEWLMSRIEEAYSLRWTFA